MPDIAYIEDDAAIAQSVRQYLEQHGYRVTVLPGAAQARQALERRRPALALLDWNLPDGGGDALCRWLHGRWPGLPVIFLTVRDDARDIVQGLAAGADDYVIKPFELAVLLARIRALLRRSGDAAGDVLCCGGITLDRKRTAVLLDGEEVPLSPAEYALLLYLLENKGRTVTREALLAHLWDDHGSFVNDNTLTVTVKRLREKLRSPGCLKTVRSIGYRLEETP